MQQITASQAKQNFGDLLEAAARAPVAIERHKRVRAIVCSPEAFAAGAGAPSAVDAEAVRAQRLAERRAARDAQALIDKDRLIRHQRLAIDLLLMTAAERDAQLALARSEVARWRRDGLCSPDYCQRWDELLALPIDALARAMGSDALEWGVALRQNSPWTSRQP